jgi:hypothetical protein
MDLKETENVGWIPLALDGPMPVLLHAVTNLQCAHNAGDFLSCCETVSISRRTFAMYSYCLLLCSMMSAGC